MAIAAASADGKDVFGKNGLFDELKKALAERMRMAPRLMSSGGFGHLSKNDFMPALRSAFTLSKRWLAMLPVEMKRLVLDIVERVTIAANRIDIWVNRAKIAAALEVGVCGGDCID
jgi:hypothetical protein